MWGIPQGKVFFGECILIWGIILAIIFLSIVHECMIEKKLGREYATNDILMPNVVELSVMLLELILVLIVSFIIAFISSSNVYIVFELLTLGTTLFWTIMGYTEEW